MSHPFNSSAPGDVSVAHRAIVGLSLDVASPWVARLLPGAEVVAFQSALRGACERYWSREASSPAEERLFVEDTLAAVRAGCGDRVASDLERLFASCFIDEQAKSQAFVWRVILRFEGDPVDPAARARRAPPLAGRIVARLEADAPEGANEVGAVTGFDTAAYERYGYTVAPIGASAERSPLPGLRAAARQAELIRAFQRAIEASPDPDGELAELLAWARERAGDAGIPPDLVQAPSFAIDHAAIAGG